MALIKHTIILLFICSACSSDQNNNARKDLVVEFDDHIDLSKTTPIKFLMELRKVHKPAITSDLYISNCPNRIFIMCNPVDSNWIQKEDIPLLISYLDSNNVIAIPIFSTLASITIENHGQSTIANEAYALIQGYRTGHYPPYSSIPLGGDEYDTFELQDSLKEETLKWWAATK